VKALRQSSLPRHRPGFAAALPRRVLAAAGLVACILAACAANVSAQPSFAPGTLCLRSAFLPPPVPLPSFAPASLFSFYSETPSTNALAHHVLCRVEITTPHSSPAYLYHASWYAFPTHADALADLAAFNPDSVYTSARVTHGAAGVPSPSEIVSGRYDGVPITVVISVDGPTLLSGYVLGGGTLAEAEALARWEASVLRHLHA
jgi:hypothetical protein